MPPHLLKVEGQGLYNMYVEFLIRRSRSRAVIFLRESTAAATLLFSILHTCVMYGFVKKSSSNFWFSSFQINAKATSKCDQVHGSLSCSEYIKKVKQSNKLQNQTMQIELVSSIGVDENFEICLRFEFCQDNFAKNSLATQETIDVTESLSEEIRLRSGLVLSINQWHL